MSYIFLIFYSEVQTLEIEYIYIRLCKCVQVECKERNTSKLYSLESTVKPACSVVLIKCQPAYSATYFCPDPSTPETIYPILCHPCYSVDFGCPDGGILIGLHCTVRAPPEPQQRHGLERRLEAPLPLPRSVGLLSYNV